MQGRERQMLKINKPSETCAICNRTLEDVGAKRIDAQSLKGVCLSTKYLKSGDKDYQHRIFKLSDDSGTIDC